MLDHDTANALMGIVPNRVPAVLTLNADFSAVPQPGTISGSGSTITGIGTSFQSGSTGKPALQVGSKLVANATSGPLNYIAAGLNSVVAGTLLTVTAIASDTSLTVSQTGLSFSGKAFFADQSITVNINGAWIKPISRGLKKYGFMNLQGDETLIKIPDNELNPAGNGYQIRTNDIITIDDDIYTVTTAGTTLKTVLTVWECVCKVKAFSN